VSALRRTTILVLFVSAWALLTGGAWYALTPKPVAPVEPASTFAPD